ncbi:hypothetical protein LIER_00702 [Lithospermum erythrorhizon]|uniref:Uncharacterized protein n=1 Tax=Lithospermum erythrorhizon TaxID=34254 RepID=A0AAV3NMU1_LITER
MPGLSSEVALHKLHVNPSHRPMKKKKRNFLEEKSLAIRSEVDKLIKAGAIKELQFSEWISNVIGRNIEIYVDDMLIDSIAQRNFGNWLYDE